MVTIKGLIRLRTEVETWDLIGEKKDRLLEALDHVIAIHYILHEKNKQIDKLKRRKEI